MLLKKTKDPVSRAASRHNGRRGREKAELARRTRRQERQENLQVQNRPSPKTAGTPLSTENSSCSNEGQAAVVKAAVPPAAGEDQTLTPHFGARVLVQCARACGGFIYYHLLYKRAFASCARVFCLCARVYHSKTLGGVGA